MIRATLLATAASLALFAPFGAGASGGRSGSPTAGRADVGTISLRARVGRNSWKPSLSIKLVKTRLIPFEVCAIWDQPPTATWGTRCNAATGTRLPERTMMRLEQSPIRRALPRDDSPGWGLLGMSDHAEIEAVLSNTVSGNRYGTINYRVTLRDSTGQVLATSNTLKLLWHK